jgi:predicted amidohydrolase
VKVAAYQAPLLASGSMDALGLIRKQVECCEIEGVSILCCPEAILGGLADYAEDPTQFAMRVDTGHLESVLAPIASSKVTTIVGFTELGDRGRLYNSAAVFQRGSVAGVYRKLHPAINQSVYSAGLEVPIFRVGDLTFGIIICNDSNFTEPARIMASQGATALLVPTNCGLPPEKGGPELIDAARKVDMATAVENGIWVIRADVAGRAGGLLSYGSSGIVDPNGRVMQSARQLSEDLIIAEIDAAADKIE